MNRRLHGIVLSELLVTVLIVGAVLLLLGNSFMSLHSAWLRVTEHNPAIAEHRRIADLLTDHVRNAQACRNSSNGKLDSAFEYVKPNEFAYYSDKDTCETVRYVLDGTNIKRKEEDGEDVIVAKNVTDFTCVYYQSNKYHSAWYPAISNTIDSNDDLKKIAGMRIRLITSVNGQTNSTAFTIRLRNSPKKTRLDGL